MKKLIIPLVILLLAGIGGVVALVLGFLTASRDIPPPNTRDLVLERTTLPPEQNAYTYFSAATNSLCWPSKESFTTAYLDHKPADENAVQEVLARNRNTVILLGEGLKRQRCITPEITGIKDRIPYIVPWCHMSRLLALKARHERLAGQPAEAAHTCSALLQFGDLVQKDAGCTLGYFTGLGALELGLEQARDLASDKETPAADLVRLSEVLATLTPLDRGFVRMAKVECLIDLSAVDLVRGGSGGEGLPGVGHGGDWLPLNGPRIFRRYSFQPNKTKLVFAEICRDLIRNAPLPYAQQRRLDQTKAYDPNASKLRLCLEPNIVGKMLYAMLLFSTDKNLERKCWIESSVAATRLLVACKAYEKKEGRLPNDLQTLVPTYLAAIPRDPFDGQPFRYSASKGIVYSVGKDLIDSGGSTKLRPGEKDDNVGQRRWRTEDAVFEINERIEQPSGGGSSPRVSSVLGTSQK